ncbi:sigma-70 family RNA polymerase sigma factor [Phytomonospora sp. NPDC050363]|uniref:sigma-70 family RNA polymerase sigma factor n=1 Tax=Phytomonospora sp. NPDC050363 TaxID=3155642 RepID=UPI00340E3F72
MDQHSDRTASTATVTAARSGDPRARERLVAAYLPLVYNVVGRAMNGHPDVDDVVQETMLKAIDGLGRLRDAASFRSWLIAIAMNEVRRRWSHAQRAPLPATDRVGAAPDPAGDFVELSILRLGLSAQRREIAEATRWLDADDRDLLALWWQESAGRLTREELAAAMDLTTGHAAVRVQRMKTQLDLARQIVRALSATWRCGELTTVVATWDGRPSPLWRKRVARHVRDCSPCSRSRDGLAPAERLLAGMALVPVPAADLAVDPSLVASAPARPGWLRPVAAVGTLAGVAALVLLWPSKDPAPEAPPAATPSVSVSASPPPAPAEADRTSPAPAPAETRLIEAINALRADAGCDALAEDPELREAARRHAEDMAAQGFFDHTGSDGSDAGERITAAGYTWGGWAENLYLGSAEPDGAAGAWMDSAGHRENMLACDYTAAGAAAVDGPQGTIWVLDLARPA